MHKRFLEQIFDQFTSGWKEILKKKEIHKYIYNQRIWITREERLTFRDKNKNTTLLVYINVKYTRAFQIRSPTSNYIKTRQLIINQVHYDIVQRSINLVYLSRLTKPPPLPLPADLNRARVSRSSFQF